MPGPDYDLVIVGGGMAGAALARALSGSAGAGLRLALVEARPMSTEGIGEPAPVESPSDFDTRVSAITPASQGFLSRIGAWDALAAARICPYRAMRVWDADGTGAIEFSAAEVDAPVLGHIIENRLITAALLEGLDRVPGLDLLSPARLDRLDREDGIAMLSLEDGSKLGCSLLVAADGALSPVRELAGGAGPRQGLPAILVGALGGLARGLPLISEVNRDRLATRPASAPGSGTTGITRW